MLHMVVLATADKTDFSRANVTAPCFYKQLIVERTAYVIGKRIAIVAWSRHHALSKARDKQPPLIFFFLINFCRQSAQCTLSIFSFPFQFS